MDNVATNVYMIFNKISTPIDTLENGGESVLAVDNGGNGTPFRYRQEHQ